MWKTSKKEGLSLMYVRERPEIRYQARAGERSAFFRLQKTFELLRAHAFLGERAPLYAGGPDWAGVQMAALLARGIRLVGPYLYLLAALLAPDIFRFRRTYLSASWASFFKHDYILPLPAGKIYDAHHIEVDVTILYRIPFLCPRGETVFAGPSPLRRRPSF